MENSYYFNKHIDELMKKDANDLKTMYEQPLEVIINHEEIIARYKGASFLMKRDDYSDQYLKQAVNDWVKSIDRSVREAINNFTNPIYKEVFGTNL